MGEESEYFFLVRDEDEGSRKKMNLDKNFF
jgi:hypothetical protein